VKLLEKSDRPCANVAYVCALRGKDSIRHIDHIIFHHHLLMEG
jgi:hypothetical protein